VTLRALSNLYNLSVLTGIFDDFHTRYPRIEIRLDVAPWRESLNSLKKGEIELAIGFADELDDRYLFIPITKRPQQLYCGPKHRFFGKPSVSPAVRAEPFVVTRDEPLPYIRYRDPYGLGRRIGGFADSLNERMWLIQLGMGLGFLPKPIVESSNFASVPWPLLPDDEALICSVYLGTPHEVRQRSCCWIRRWHICSPAQNDTAGLLLRTLGRLRRRLSRF
jgi:DNA-binding transcriptional LysR family regulator